jgi:hypothetical protein
MIEQETEVKPGAEAAPGFLFFRKMSMRPRNVRYRPLASCLSRGNNDRGSRKLNEGS